MMEPIMAAVPFDMVFDTDLGLVKVIQMEYADKSVFYEGLLKIGNVEILKDLAVNRVNWNPVTILIKDEHLAKAEDLYRQFIEKEYDKILMQSVPTAIYNLIDASEGADDVLRFDILCENDKQYKYASEYFKNAKIKQTILPAPMKDFDLSDYGNVYCRNIAELELYKQGFDTKNILVANMSINKEPGMEDANIPPLKYVKDYGEDNKFQYIDLYTLPDNKFLG